MTAPLPEPLYFGAPACFGWLHRAHRPAAGLPVLVCGPLGAEDLSAHALLRQAAEALATQGLPCLRFDPAGSGDSAPRDPGTDAVAAALASVHAAIDALRRATGAPRVALLGLRLGATLAAVAAQDRDDIAAFAAWVPVVSGRAMLREWKLLGAAGLPSVAHPDGSLESGGFHHDGATCAALSKLTLQQPLVRPARRMLVIDRTDLPSAGPWCEALAASGVEIDQQRLPGFEGLMAVPHLVVLPQAMLDHAVAWLQQVSWQLAPAAPPLLALPAPAAMDLCVQDTPVRERALYLNGSAGPSQAALTPMGGGLGMARPGGRSGGEPALFALRTDRAESSGLIPRTAVLVLNTGAERRIGPHGQFVALARRWAAAGALVLRLDLAGLGDSPAREGGPVQRVYPPEALADIHRAVAYLRQQPGVQRVVVMGLCSGAFHAFEAAAEGLAVDLAVMINPLLFFRPEREDFDAVPAQDHAVQQLSGQALRHLRDPARWRKLLRGEADWRFLAAMLVRRQALAGRRLRRGAARRLGRPWPDDLTAKLARAARLQGEGAVPPRLCFVFASNDPGLALLRAEAGHTLNALLRKGKVRIETVDDADHTFSRSDARQRLQAVLDQVLGLAMAEPGRRAAAAARNGAATPAQDQVASA